MIFCVSREGNNGGKEGEFRVQKKTKEFKLYHDRDWSLRKNQCRVRMKTTELAKMHAHSFGF
ncbi:hypothetical protein BOW43_12290 [Solemya velum gill symbiont]|nr:hypothetical protein BOW43_12290 [Solemya velum gill symbiont]